MHNWRPLFVYETPADQGGGSTLGTGEGSAAPAGQPAGASNTETPAGGVPETVPYPRFKEVNDAYRPFKEMADAYGADADSMRQLLDWDAAFAADPSNAWLQVGEAYLDQLPPPVAEAIRQVRSGNSGEGGDQGPKTGAASEVAQGDDPPEWFKRWEKESYSKTAETVQQREEREAEDARQALLDDILDQWEQQDKAEGVVWAHGDDAETQTRAIRLSYIRNAAMDTKSVEEILPQARRSALAFREGILRDAHNQGKGVVAPLAVPSGGPAPGNKPEVPKTLAAATKAAERDILAGNLTQGGQ